ncbi:MAG: recombinase family protein [Armatimonadota bacterium]|nr:recombinase family protein [Armatimonadota bacterium]
MALYARVSTKEQTEGKYPSCDSQIEELKAFCQTKGWEVYESIKDEGVSAGSLKRQGLTQLRWLVESGQIDGVICTWYDRLVRTRDFYVLDKEFTTHHVEFITLHDPTDRRTASGRFLETMLVAAKTYEREQTGEKVRTKMRMRAEKGMWNGGLIPFGFCVDTESQLYYPDPDKKNIVLQLFQTYVDTRSDFAVRDWLKHTRCRRPTASRYGHRVASAIC